MPLPLRPFAWFCASFLAAACGSRSDAGPELPVRFVEIASYGDAEPLIGDAPPVLEVPAYLRGGPDGAIWTLETKRKAAVRLGMNGYAVRREGRPGHGPGEIAVALGIDVSPGQTVWVADPGNGKIVGFEDGKVVSEFMVDHAPLGIVAPSDDGVWVGGDLVNSVLVRYDRAGRKIGTAGVPILRTSNAMRLNQGVLAQGGGPCPVVWAYRFHSVVECFDLEGKTRWRTDGPVRIAPDRGANPISLSEEDVFAYTDVSTDGERVYALFRGGPAGKDGLQTRDVHVFDAQTGAFTGRWRLPRPAHFILRRDSSFVLMADEPAPVVRVYRTREGGRP